MFFIKWLALVFLVTMFLYEKKKTCNSVCLFRMLVKLLDKQVKLMVNKVKENENFLIYKILKKLLSFIRFSGNFIYATFE